MLVRTRQACAEEGYFDVEDPSPCGLDRVRRTVWDGAQVLYEVQMPDTLPFRENDSDALPDLTAADPSPYFDPNPYFGRVAYTHGPGLDRPLSAVRIGYADEPLPGQPFHAFGPFSLALLWDRSGQVVLGAFGDGSDERCEFPGGQQRCVQTEWPRTWWAYYRSQGRSVWHGSLLEEQVDATGTAYRRNRYYDPETGRFTQEDPIGLAGGLNLYGYANGDPVTFSDPFGLSAEEGEEAACLPCLARAAQLLRAAGPAISGAARAGNALLRTRSIEAAGIVARGGILAQAGQRTLQVIRPAAEKLNDRVIANFGVAYH